MHTRVASDGVVTRQSNTDRLEIAGRDYFEAPFEQRWDDLYAFIDEGTGPAALTYEA